MKQSTKHRLDGDSLRALRDAMRAVWSAPSTWLLLLCVSLASAWAAHVSTLLRPGGSRLGTILQALLWSCLFAATVLAYCATAPNDREHARRVVRRTAVALLLALAATHLSRLALSPLLAPAAWISYDHLRVLLPLLLAAVWCAALLPAETRSLVRSVADSRTLTPLPALVLLLVAAATLVSCTDLAFQLVRSGSAVASRIAVDVIDLKSWFGTTVILFCVFAMVFAVTSSASLTLLLVSPIYAVMVFATLVKIRYMHSAVQPLDLLSVSEFMPLFASFFGTWAIVASALGIMAWVATLVFLRRRATSWVPPHRRVAVALVSATPMIALLLAFFFASSRYDHRLEKGAVARAVLSAFGAPQSEHIEGARRTGIVLNFLFELPSAFVVPPPEYSRDRVTHIVRAYTAAAEARLPVNRTKGVNLVIYMVESLMDPADLGLRYSSDPMPNLRMLRRSHPGLYGIVPERFGGSANTEFEVLTGMTTTFLPQRSLPYRQYVRRPIPSLPGTLRELGYRTVAIQADPRYYYDRERVYPLLGFDDVVWLRDASGAKRADRGSWPSDDAVVDAVFAASATARPFFVFAFPSSTHSPYNSGVYSHSDLDVLGAPTSAAADEVKEYVNAVRVADRAIGRLIDHFRNRSDSTVIAVLGDHLPPLSAGALETFFERLGPLSVDEQERATRSVPLLVWANFDLPPEQMSLGANMLAPFLLEMIGVPRTGMFAVTDSLRRALPVMVSRDRQGDREPAFASMPAGLRGMLEDYRVVQHDILLGQQYSLSSVPTRARQASRDPATGRAASH